MLLCDLATTVTDCMHAFLIVIDGFPVWKGGCKAVRKNIKARKEEETHWWDEKCFKS